MEEIRIAIVSDLSSQGAVDPLLLQLGVAIRSNSSLSSVTLDSEHFIMKDALAAHPAPAIVMVLLGATNSAHQRELNELLNTWRDAPARSVLLLISSSYKNTRDFLDVWLSTQSSAALLRPWVKVSSGYLENMQKLEHTLEHCLQVLTKHSPGALAFNHTIVTGNILNQPLFDFHRSTETA